MARSTAGLAGLLAVAVLTAGACASSTDNTTASSATTTAPTTAQTSTTPTVTTEPATTEPATTEAAATEPATTEPALAGPLTIQQLLDLGRPIVLAHAAGEDQHPHSTPYGYAESAKAGVDMLDFDVQLTRDGVLVVQHDDSTGRTTNADLVVADTDYADLASLDNAYWFTPDCTCTGQPDAAYTLRGVRTGDTPPPAGYTPEDFIIPRFRDIAARFADLAVNIEIKGSGPPAVAAATELAKELTELDLLDNAVVTSFDDTVVDAFHAVAPTVEVTPGLGLSSAWILNGTPLPGGMRILQLPPVFQDIQVLTPQTISDSHAAGYVIWVWPNDRIWENPDGYAKLLAMGLDGLNINVPDQGVQAVRDFIG